MEAKFQIKSNLNASLNDFLHEFGVKDTKGVIRKSLKTGAENIEDAVKNTFPKDTGISHSHIDTKIQKPTKQTLKSLSIQKSGATQQNTAYHAFVGFFFSQAVDKRGGYSKNLQPHGLFRRLWFIERFGYRSAKSVRNPNTAVKSWWDRKRKEEGQTTADTSTNVQRWKLVRDGGFGGLFRRNFTSYTPPLRTLEKALFDTKDKAVDAYRLALGRGMVSRAKAINKKNKLKVMKK